jgi:uncharacterized membrane protein
MPCVNHPDRDSTARCVVCSVELCDECRTETDGRNYCAADAKTAAPAAVSPPPVAVPPPSPPVAPATPVPAATAADDPGQEQPVLAALSYVIGVIISVIILFSDMKKSRYMRFHAFHSLFYCLGIVVVAIGLGVVGMVLGFIPIINVIAGVLLGIIGAVFPLCVLILSIILAVKAYNRQELELPVVTKMAREQTDKMRV